MDRWERIRPQLVEILVDVLIRQVAAQEGAVDVAAFPRQVPEGALDLALLEELEKPLEVEPGRGPTDKPLPAEVKREGVRVVGSDVLDVVDGRPPRELDGLEKGVRARPRNALTRRRANAEAIHRGFGVFEVRAQTGHGP